MAVQNMLTGLGLGAGLMYLLDPDMGKRRQGILRDKLLSAYRQVSAGIDVAFRDAGNRLEGVLAELRSSLFEEERVPDQTLAARVRSTLGRYVSHPSVVEVRVQDGRVILSGPILAREAENLLSAVSGVRGVQNVENRLEVHAEPGDVPELQGGRARPGAAPELLQTNWSPATRLWAGAVGSGLMYKCARNPSLVNVTLGTFGFGLFLRAVASAGTRRLIGPGREVQRGDIPRAIGETGPQPEELAAPRPAL
jgi:hypothetical protein